MVNKCILMPVDSKYPHFLGAPYILVIPQKTILKWERITRNPSGLVVSECENSKGKCWHNQGLNPIFNNDRKIIVKGTNLESRSSSLNKIKGDSVDIN